MEKFNQKIEQEPIPKDISEEFLNMLWVFKLWNIIDS